MKDFSKKKQGQKDPKAKEFWTKLVFKLEPLEFGVVFSKDGKWRAFMIELKNVINLNDS